MKFWITLVLISTLFLGCVSKKKLVERSKVETTEYVKIDSVNEIKIDSTVIAETKQVVKKDNNLKTDSGSVEITGKSDTTTPFTYYNIQGTDTLQSISIVGNADFKIKNNWLNKSEKKDETTVTEALNKLAQISREAVAKETIKKNSEKIEKINIEVKKTGGTFGAYMVYIGWIIIALCIVYILSYFSGGINLRDIFKRIIKIFKK